MEAFVGKPRESADGLVEASGLSESIVGAFLKMYVEAERRIGRSTIGWAPHGQDRR